MRIGRVHVLSAAVLLVLVGGWVLIDHLIVTDEERVAELVDDVSGPIDSQSIHQAFRWVDPAEEPVEVQVMGQSLLYDADSGGELRDRARAVLARSQGDNFRALRSGVSVEGDDAEASVYLLTARGAVQLEFNLRRHGERWLIRRVRISR